MEKIAAEALSVRSAECWGCCILDEEDAEKAFRAFCRVPRVRICICICIHVYIYIYMHMYVYARICIPFVDIDVCIYIQSHIDICTLTPI